MFLHSGAAMHGHEFSRPSNSGPRPNNLPRRSPLARSAFSSPITKKSTIYENKLPSITRSTRPFADDICRSTDSFVRFREPERDTMSDDGRSVANSDDSEVTAGSRRRRRLTRTSTSFFMAHPAPTLTQTQRLLQIRPKLLFQLQLLSPDSRPVPALDVLPSTVVVPRLAKMFPRMLKTKGQLGANDVIVVKSEEYQVSSDTVIEDDTDEDGDRDVVAVICQSQKDRAAGIAEIDFSDETKWIATPLQKGLFEFVNVDANGHKTTARWIRRTNRVGVDLTDLNARPEVKFVFSIINENLRRHPILATLTQSKLDIPDFYTSIGSAGKCPPTSPIRGVAGESESDTMEEESQRRTFTIDEATKSLIQVTGIWLALRQEWSPYFKYNDSMSLQATPGNRARSGTTENRLSPAPICTSTPESTISCSTLGVLGNKIRRVSMKASPGLESPQGDSSGPQRSISAGTAFMQRVAARRMNQPSTVQSESEGESTCSLNRSATGRTNNNATMRTTTPTPLSLPASATATPIPTPTRPQRHSAFISPSIVQNFKDDTPQRHSMIDSSSKDSFVAPKKNKWKAFTNFVLRRSNRTD